MASALATAPVSPPLTCAPTSGSRPCPVSARPMVRPPLPASIIKDGGPAKKGKSELRGHAAFSIQSEPAAYAAQAVLKSGPGGAVPNLAQSVLKAGAEIAPRLYG